MEIILPLGVIFTQKDDLHIMRGERVSMDNEMDRLADLLASLIEKYSGELDIECLPDPPRATDD